MTDCPLLFEVLIGLKFNFAKTTIIIIFTRPKILCLTKYASLPLRMLNIKCFYSDFRCCSTSLFIFTQLKACVARNTGVDATASENGLPNWWLTEWITKPTSTVQSSSCEEPRTLELVIGQGSELPKVLFKVPNFLWKCSCEELRTLQACPWAEEERQADDATSQNAPQLAQNADQSRKQIWFCKTDSSYWSDPLICKLHLALSRTFHPALYCI